MLSSTQSWCYMSLNFKSPQKAYFCSCLEGLTGRNGEMQVLVISDWKLIKSTLSCWIALVDSVIFLNTRKAKYKFTITCKTCRVYNYCAVPYTQHVSPLNGQWGWSCQNPASPLLQVPQQEEWTSCSLQWCFSWSLITQAAFFFPTSPVSCEIVFFCADKCFALSPSPDCLQTHTVLLTAPWGL